MPGTAGSDGYPPLRDEDVADMPKCKPPKSREQVIIDQLNDAEAKLKYLQMSRENDRRTTAMLIDSLTNLYHVVTDLGVRKDDELEKVIKDKILELIESI